MKSRWLPSIRPAASDLPSLPRKSQRRRTVVCVDKPGWGPMSLREAAERLWVTEGSIYQSASDYGRARRLKVRGVEFQFVEAEVLA